MPVKPDLFEKPKSYQAVPNTAQPNTAYQGAANLNPVGSRYAEQYNKTTTKLIKE